MEYEFTFVVDGTTVDDDTSVTRLEAELDAMLARAGGVNLLTIAYDGAHAVEAAVQAATAARACVPDLRIIRLDRDLVGIQEIAERTERSRQNVHQWINGDRLNDNGPFPLPEGSVGRTQAWLWAEVNEWLRGHGLDDGTHYPSREEMAVIDVALQSAVTLGFHFAPGDGHEEGRRAVLDELMADHIAGIPQFLARAQLKTNGRGEHAVVVAAADESAFEVMQFVARFDQDVLLVTSADAFIGVVLSTNLPPRPSKLVSVRAGATVGEWMALVRDNPGAAFAAESPAAQGEPPTRIQRRQSLEIAA